MGGGCGLDKQPPSEGGTRVGSVQMPEPWGLAQFLEVKESRWLRGTNSHPTRPRRGWTLGSWWLWQHQLIAPPPHPIPQEGKQHQGLAPPGGGKTTLQVIRFKLKIIKITYKINKDNPCPNKPGPLETTWPTDTLRGGGGTVISLQGSLPRTQAGPGRVVQPPPSAAAGPRKSHLGQTQGRHRGYTGLGSR